MRGAIIVGEDARIRTLNGTSISVLFLLFFLAICDRLSAELSVANLNPAVMHGKSRGLKRRECKVSEGYSHQRT